MAGLIRDTAERLMPLRPALLVATCLMLVTNLVVAATFSGAQEPAALTIADVVDAAPLRAPTGDNDRAGATSSTESSTSTEAPATTEEATTSTEAEEPTTTVAPAEEKAAANPRSAAGSGPWSLEPYRGLGAWVDVYDWSMEFTGGAPTINLVDIDDMAKQGVQTLYIQTGHRRSGADIMEPQRQVDLINRAHEHGMQVVGWYLPMLEDLNTDLHRMVVAAQKLPLDGYGVDIESINVGDVAERNRRLLDLSARLRSAIGPDKVLSAITPSAVHLQVVNPAFWPAFPWAELTAVYDVFQPMAYWSVRRPEWKSGERYIAENIDRIRAATGRPDLPVHPVGGIADGASIPDVQGMLKASTARGAIGLSLYDWRTSNPAQWKVLAPIRR